MSILGTVILTIVLTLLFIPYVLFIWRYSRHSPWNATWQGVTLLTQKITMATLVGFFIVDTLIAGDWPGRYSLLMILLTLLMVESWATLAGLLHVQRKSGPVSKRQGTGYVEPEQLQTDPKRITTIHPDKEKS